MGEDGLDEQRGLRLVERQTQFILDDLDGASQGEEVLDIDGVLRSVAESVQAAHHSGSGRD